MPRLAALSLSDSPNPPQVPCKEEISPVAELGPAIVEPENNDTSTTNTTNSDLPEIKTTPPTDTTTNRRNSQFPDDDIHALDDEGWCRVANSGGIEELLSLGEGVSGTVHKCRLRKSGQVFAIKVKLR
jgi:hypothetical protein